jgi:hypothetical protein
MQVATCQHGLIQTNLGRWRVLKHALILTTIKFKAVVLTIKFKVTGTHTLGGIKLFS